MSFPAYSAYTDSGVEWLGQVPEHWSVRRLKFTADLVTEKADEKINPVALENIESWSGKFLPTDTEFEGDGVAFHTNDILFGKLRPYLAKVFLANSPGEAVGDFHVLRPNAEVLPKFLHLQLLEKNFINIVDGSTFGSKMPRAGWEFVGSMPLPMPTLEEQADIADFLDQETSKIDALIQEQQKLIELLREERQAMISHAVTKGLNTNAALLESGNRFLGQVPAHWQVKRVKHVVKSLDQGWSPQCEGYPVESENEWGVLKAGCVNGGVFSPEENKTLPSDLAPIPELGVVAGDLMISRANTKELVGSAAVALRDYPHLLLCDKLYRLRLFNDMCDSVFLGYFFGTDLARSQIELGASGASSSMQNISQSTILEMPIAFPPLHEQHSIVESIGQHVKTTNALIQEADTAIELLAERRSALVSAAVTGKIDVRGLA